MEQIYDQLMSVLGGTNPNQFFCMTVPGTMLNQSDFAYDTTGNKPAVVAEAESRLVDQMFDIAQITGSSNGQRVSSQYLQALSALVPTFAPMMPAMKNSLREFLASPAPPDAVVDGIPFTGTIEGFYFALYEDWLDRKAAWDRDVIEYREKHSPEKFLEWYEGVAEGRLARIDAAEGRLLVAFSPTDMDAILGALAAGPGGELQEAADQVLNLRLPSPSGGYIYPVDLQPSDWFLDLASDQDPANLLKDPQFIAATIGARRQAILASISQVQAMLDQMPTTGAIAAAANAYTDAQSAYSAAQTALLNTYTANTVTAVELVLAAATGGESEVALEGVEGVEALDESVAAISEASGDSPVQTAATKSDSSPLSVDDLKNLMDGQNKVIAAQGNLVDTAGALSAAGMNLASKQAASFGGLPALLARLQSQLGDLQSLQGQLSTSIGAAKRAQPKPPSEVSDGTTPFSSAEVAQAAALVQFAKAAPNQQANAWLVSLLTELTTNPKPAALSTVYVSAYAAWVAAVADAVSNAAFDIGAASTAVAEAAQKAVGVTGATADTVTTAATAATAAVVPTGVADALKARVAALTKGADAAAMAGAISNEMAAVAAVAAAGAAAAANAATVAQTASYPTAIPKPADVVDPVSSAVQTATKGMSEISNYLAEDSTGVSAVAANGPEAMRASADAAAVQAGRFKVQDTANPTKNSKAVPAGSADRWMDLQFSFTSSDMSSSDASSSLSSQTSWSVDLFLGSASGTSSNSSATTDHEALDTTMSIQIGMKATKVDISRGWFDPGIFKVSKNMNRFTDEPVSVGPVPFVSPADGSGTPLTPDAIKAGIKAANDDWRTGPERARRPGLARATP